MTCLIWRAPAHPEGVPLEGPHEAAVVRKEEGELRMGGPGGDERERERRRRRRRRRGGGGDLSSTVASGSR